MTIGRRAAVRGPVPLVRDPLSRNLLGLQFRDESAQGALVTDAKADVAEPRCLVRRQLERVPFVIAPAAEIDRVAGAAGLMKTKDRREEPQAFVGPRRVQLDVADVRDIPEAREGRADCRRSLRATRRRRRIRGHGGMIAPG